MSATTADKQVPHQAEQTVRFPYVSYHRGDADAPDACYDGVCSHPDPSERAHIWGEYSGVRGGHGLDTSWSETCKVCGIERQTADKQVPHQAEQTVRFPYVSYHRDGELVS